MKHLLLQSKMMQLSALADEYDSPWTKALPNLVRRLRTHRHYDDSDFRPFAS